MLLSTQLELVQQISRDQYYLAIWQVRMGISFEFIAAGITSFIILRQLLTEDRRTRGIYNLVVSLVVLGGTRFTGASLVGANFAGVSVAGCDFSGANITRTNWHCATGLPYARWSHPIFNEPVWRSLLVSKDGSRTNLRRAELQGVNLAGASLQAADLSSSTLDGATLKETDLRKADFREARLIDTNLDGATLTDACLWETQRAGWSIQGIICEAAYWDKDGQERTLYSPGEFERLYADKMKIVLHYEGGLSPIEIVTLPALIERIEATHPGCVLRLHSIQDAPGGATVTLIVEDGGDARSLSELRTLKTSIETASQQIIHLQRTLLEETGLRQQIQSELEILYNRIIPRIVGHTYVYGELTMGDSFSNIGSGATIVNRAFVQNAFNKVKTKYDEETAKALKLVEDEINKSGNPAAAETFNAFNQELDKPEPQKPVLQALWQGVVTALPSITKLTDVAEKIAKLCSS